MGLIHQGNVWFALWTYCDTGWNFHKYNNLIYVSILNLNAKKLFLSEELEVDLEHIKWDIVGIREIRRQL